MLVGSPELTFITSSIKIVILLPLVVCFSSEWGLEGASYAYLITYKFVPFMHGYLTSKYLDIKFRAYFSCLIRPVISSLLMYFVLSTEWFQNIIFNLNSEVLSLLMYSACGAAIYFVTIFLLWVVVRRPDSVELKVYKILVALLDKIISRVDIF